MTMPPNRSGGLLRKIELFMGCSGGFKYVKKMVKIGSVVFELKWGRKLKLCRDSAEIGRFSFIWHIGVLKRIGISQLCFQ